MNLRTWKKLQEWVKAGHGTGHFDLYLPWLWVHRKNASPKSNQIVSQMPGYRRNSHFFSRIEWYIALLCLWLGAVDVREQFPLWPMSHPHPLADGVSDWRMPSVVGLQSIAEDAGIRHGVAPGSSDVPYIATIDIMATVYIGGSPALAGLSLKPHDLVTRAEPTDRIIERQELERRYLLMLDSHFAIPDASLVSKILRGNLDVLSLYFGQSYPNDPQTHDLLASVERLSGSLPLHAALSLASTYARLDVEDASRRLHSAIWHRSVDVDITKPIRADMQLTYGAGDLVASLQKELFGVSL